MSERGRFITLEGGEGVGKSTQAALLVDWLKGKGIDVVLTREPGGTAVAERIRALLKDASVKDLSAEAELLLIFAARTEHVQHLIRPALEAGQWVVCDRFVDASHAYQGHARGLGNARVSALAEWLVGKVEPDLTLWLDMPVEEAFERIGRRGDKDRFERENMAFFSRVHEGYRQCAERAPDRFRRVSAEDSPEVVQERCRALLMPLLPVPS